MKAYLVLALALALAAPAAAQVVSTAAAVARTKAVEANIPLIEGIGAISAVQLGFAATLDDLTRRMPAAEREGIYKAAAPIINPVLDAHRARLQALTAAHGQPTEANAGKEIVDTALQISRGGPGSLHSDLAAGATSPSPAASAQKIARIAALVENAPTIEQIGGMYAVEQAMRDVLIAAARTQSETDRNATYAEAGAIIARIDESHVARLRAIVAKDGWPRLSAVGGPAAQYAAGIANHSAESIAEAVALMEPLVAQREVVPADFARLSDRLATLQGRPQRYGTQGDGCQGGRLVPARLEDPDNVDERRRRVGLEPLADFLERLNRSNGGC